jgi:two-component system, NarL family, captular synthesis response regulator RcsB
MSVPTIEQQDAVVHVTMADDHPVVLMAVRNTLNAIPGFQVTATARSGKELIETLETTRCDLIITDFNMNAIEPGQDGLQLIRYLKRAFPATPVVVFTMLANGGVLFELGKLHVNGIVSKEEDTATLAQVCTRVLASNELVISPAIETTFALSGGYKSLDRPQRLSPREIEVVRLFALGVSLTEIARRLHRTTATIGTQKRSAMRKLHVNTNVDLIRYATEHGLV